MSKTKLQTYCQKRSLLVPEYSCEREGPSHAIRFKCTVSVDGKIYESSGFFTTLKEAETDAANIALASLAPNGDEEDHSSYKNLLQELAQRETYNLPTYETTCFGQSHIPIFISTLIVGAEIFRGPEVKSKKQAELAAAKVAYTTLKQRAADVSTPHPPIVSTRPGDISAVNNVAFSSAQPVPLPEQCLPSAVSSFDSSMVIKEGIERLIKLESPCQNQVVIHPQQTNVPYPTGAAVEICDDNWVAVKIQTYLS